MATSVVFPRVQFFANNGRPLIGGRIHTYVAGSSTRARTYKDAAKAQPNANPIILDARGEASVYLAEGVEYKFVIEDSTGALIMTQEPVYGAIWPNAAEWPSDATLSYQYMTEAKAAAGAIGPIKFFDTKAQADAAIGTMANGDIIEVSQDETRAGARTRYKVQAGALVFVVNLDQTRIDLANPTDPANGAAMVARATAYFAAIMEVDATKLRDGDVIYAKGRASATDGGGGLFVYNSTSTQTADGGQVFTPAVGAGRFFRDGWTLFGFNGTLSVRWFGVVGDGSNEAARVQNALNAGAKLVSLDGVAVTAGVVTLPSGVGLIGDGGTLKATAGSYYQLLIPNGSVNSTVEAVTFDAAGLITAGSPTGETACISSATTTGTMSGLQVINNRFLNIPTTLGQRIHALQLNYGEAYVTGNYAPACGGDIYNFNNGYFIVVGNTAKNSGDGGIAFNNNARGCIVGNYVYKCDLGVGAGPEGTDASPDHTLLISSNEIVACGDGINMGWFGFAGKNGPRNAKIIGNTLAKCKRSGLRYDGGSSDWTGFVTIIGNTINDCGGTDYDGTAGTGLGLSIGACKYVLIEGNTLHDNAGTDIYVGSMENVHVIGNAVNAGVYAGLGGTAIDFASSHGLISGNTVYGRRVLLQHCTGTRVLGNTFTLGLTTANHGGVVVAATATETTISENNFVNCGNAVYLQHLAGWFANDVTGSNKFLGCTNKVVNSPITREGDMYVECMYTGVVDGSGHFQVFHGTANNGAYVANAVAFYKGASSESIPMTLSFVDGTRAFFTTAVGNAGKVCRAWIRFNKDAPAW